jgi:hypothetical protein
MLIPGLILSQKRPIHMDPIRNGTGVMSLKKTVKQIRKKWIIVHLFRYVVKRSYKFRVQHSSKLFEVSSICLDNFSDSCDQRTSKLTKHFSASWGWIINYRTYELILHRLNLGLAFMFLIEVLWFLDAFAKLRTGPVIFEITDRPSVRPCGTTRLPLGEFS